MPEYGEFEPFFEDHRPVPVTPFERTLGAFLDELWLSYPVLASQVGDHRFDHRWPDLSGTGRLARIAMLRRWRGQLGGIGDVTLTPDEVVDRQILLETIDGLLFDEEVLRQDTWDPLWYVELLGTGFFSLLGREYAPWHHRGTAFAVRLEHLPEVVAAAKENLLGLPDRPVSRLHAETALAQFGGIGELIDEALRLAEYHKFDEDAFRVPLRMAAVIDGARTALDELERFLRVDVMERARGDGRLGVQLFAQKLGHALGSAMTPAEVLARAERMVEPVRDEMFRLACGMWPAWIPDEPLPAGDDAVTRDLVVRRVLGAVAAEHRRPGELLEHCRREVARIERFVRRNQMIGLAHEPLEVTWTPTFMRAYGGAFLDAPGPLEKGQHSLFWITPPADDWPPERTESYLREDNDRMLRLLCIHEAVPGHYLQGAWANRCPSLVRSVFSSGTFVEGWAVYITQWMMDVGYGRRDAALLLTHWKFYLRTVINAILDVRVHTADLPEEEALHLMMRVGFQEEQEARAKWLRARLTAAQLLTYFVGSEELWDLEVDARRAAAAGSGEVAVPAQRIVGGIGMSPGFDERGHLEAVISHGAPGVRWIRSLILDGAGGDPPAGAVTGDGGGASGHGGSPPGGPGASGSGSQASAAASR